MSSSIKFKVISDSMSPMAARISAYGVMNLSVSILNEIIGTLKVGKPALMPSPPLEIINDFTVSVSKPPNTVSATLRLQSDQPRSLHCPALCPRRYHVESGA